MFHAPATVHGGKSNPIGKWLAKRRLDGGKSMTADLREKLEFMVGPLLPFSVTGKRKRLAK
jgi:hypothetical protein